MKPTPTVVLYLLLLMPAIATICHAQRTEAQTWQSWSNSVRDVYLSGVKEGAADAYFKAAEQWLAPGEVVKQPEPVRVTKVREAVFFFFDIAAIRDVMTDLYKDPANQYVQLSDMVFIARDKLRGDQIDESLNKARKRGLEAKLYNEKVK
jgi:hypothetical protein